MRFSALLSQLNVVPFAVVTQEPCTAEGGGAVLCRKELDQLRCICEFFMYQLVSPSFWCHIYATQRRKQMSDTLQCTAVRINLTSYIEAAQLPAVCDASMTGVRSKVAGSINAAATLL
jgi:hypothetical protein